MIELAAHSLALQLDADLVILKYSRFLWNLTAWGAHKNVPAGRGEKRRKCMDS